MPRCIRNSCIRKWQIGIRQAERRWARNSALHFHWSSGSASLCAAAPWLINSDMPLLPLLQSVSNWAPIVLIRDSKYGMPTVQSFHLLGLTMLLATVVALDLRLAGLGMKDYGLAKLARQLKPLTMGAIAVVMSSGLLIFLATPGKYLDSHPFRLKMVLLGSALLRS